MNKTFLKTEDFKVLRQKQQFVILKVAQMFHYFQE